MSESTVVALLGNNWRTAAEIPSPQYSVPASNNTLWLSAINFLLPESTKTCPHDQPPPLSPLQPAPRLPWPPAHSQSPLPTRPDPRQDSRLPAYRTDLSSRSPQHPSSRDTSIQSDCRTHRCIASRRFPVQGRYFQVDWRASNW